MIQLDTLKIEYSELTQNWSNAKLLALDSNNQVVAVAVISYATGALPQYPHAVHCEVLTYGNENEYYPHCKSYEELTGQEF